MGTFYGLHYSPWSIRARWALEHHGLSYRYREHLPMIGEPLLRIRRGRLLGPVTVPLFVDGSTRLADSTEIARHADATGSGSPLFPVGREAEVLDWSGRFERLAEDGRARTTARTAKDVEALIEAVPFPLPRPLMLVTGRVGVIHLERKYRFGAEDIVERGAAMRDTLEAAREKLGSRDYLLGDLTFADLSLAVALQFVAPLPASIVRLKPRYRACWTEPELADQFADLVAWRDGVVERQPFQPR